MNQGARTLRILEVAGSGTVGTPNAGPVSTVIEHVANRLARKGHHVSVLDSPSNAARVHLDPAVDVRDDLPAHSGRVATSGSRMLFRLLWESGVVARRAAAALERNTYDIVHVHHPAIAVLLRRCSRVPLVWTAHNANWTLARRLAYRPRAIMVRTIDRAAARAATRVAVLNEQTRDRFAHVHASVIPNGIDLAEWPRVSREEARAQLEIPPNEFHVTCVGRISPEKGIHVFTAAVKLAAREVPMVADVIGSPTGGFRKAKWVSAYASTVMANAPHVQFHGFIHRSRPEFLWRLAAADAVVIPSITEPFGLVVLEALACGARVIGADTGGIRSLLGDGTGVLVPPCDASALARAIVAQYHRGRHAGDAEVARERAAQFSWQRVTDEYNELMHDVLREATA